MKGKTNGKKQGAPGGEPGPFRTREIPGHDTAFRSHNQTDGDELWLYHHGVHH